MRKGLSAVFHSLCLLLSLWLPVQASAAPQGWEVLLEPAQLVNILAASPQVRLLHVTGDYDAGHIPGAVSAPYAEFRGPGGNPGALPSMAALTALVQRLGITPQTPVVVIHSGSNASDFGAAARVYWTLKSLGVKDLALLNGGFVGWRTANLPISREPGVVLASTFEPQWNDKWQITTPEVEELVASGEGRLIDARPEDFFEGLQASTGRPGTIKGASNLTFTNFFDGSRVLPKAQVGDMLASVTQTRAPVTVSFCNTGHQAAVNWFIMSELQGVPNTRLYAESMTEWSMADRPMDNQPNRLKHYWHMTTGWIADLIGS
ncbi:MAG: sulfurtransferase [Pseudomonadales bacterium]|nr:sulfurtransferase [Pseudomonadales bacterium]MCP5356546.1 sulfurtransferase [Pseudomonadales bacterium]